MKGFRIKTLTQIGWENYQGIWELKKLAYKLGELDRPNFLYYLEKAKDFYKELGRRNPDQYSQTKSGLK